MVEDYLISINVINETKSSLIILLKIAFTLLTTVFVMLFVISDDYPALSMIIYQYYEMK